MKDFHEQTFYELLDIKRNATQEEILKAYNRARSTYGNNSPALYSLFNKEEAQELLKLIDEAYTVLSNPFKRKEYDKDAAHYRQAQKSPQELSQGDSPSPDDTLAIPSAGDVSFYTDEGSPETNSEKKNVEATPKTEMADATLGATMFSRYKIDPAFEQEIKNIDGFSGAMLHKIRLYKNVTLDQISETTKISRSYLMAVENDNYSSLPAPVFTRGFLVQISKILNN